MEHEVTLIAMSSRVGGDWRLHAPPPPAPRSSGTSCVSAAARSGRVRCASPSVADSTPAGGEHPVVQSGPPERVGVAATPLRGAHAGAAAEVEDLALALVLAGLLGQGQRRRGRESRPARSPGRWRTCGTRRRPSAGAAPPSAPASPPPVEQPRSRSSARCAAWLMMCGPPRIVRGRAGAHRGGARHGGHGSRTPGQPVGSRWRNRGRAELLGRPLPEGEQIVAAWPGRGRAGGAGCPAAGVGHWGRGGIRVRRPPPHPPGGPARPRTRRPRARLQRRATQASRAAACSPGGRWHGRWRTRSRTRSRPCASGCSTCSGRGAGDPRPSGGCSRRRGRILGEIDRLDTIARIFSRFGAPPEAARPQPWTSRGRRWRGAA